jgi:hypothetical protein
MELTDAQRQFLENPFVGVVTTLQPDGMPQSTVVWVDVDEEGPYRWFKLSGTGTLVDDGADEQIDRLSKKYTGRDVYASRQPGEKRVTVRITPTRALSRGLD